MKIETLPRILFTTFVLACALAAKLPASESQASESFSSQAVQQYTAAMELPDRDQRLAKFERAEQLFLQAIEALQSEGKRPSAELYVNCGNAALQAEHIGKAIVGFRRALELDPGNSQAQQNLSYARRALPESIERSANSDLVDTLFFWKRLYSRQAIQIAGAFMFLCGAVLLSTWLATKQTLWRNLSIAPVLIWLMLVSSTWFGKGQASKEAVVTSQSATLYAADSENSPPRLSDPLPDGTEVEVLQKRELWTEVRISGRTGWLPSSTITLL